MKRWFLSLTALFIFGLFLLPGSAQAVRVGEPQRLASHAFVDDHGGLWMWGNNKFSALALPYVDPSAEDRAQSVDRVDAPIKVMDDVVSVSCGSYYTAAIKSDHTLWMWGDNTVGQLGNGGYSNRGYVVENFVYSQPRPHYEEIAYKYQDVPIKVMDDVATVDCLGDVVTAVKTDGTLWTWGENRAGQLSIGSDRKYQSTPVKMMDDVVAVSAGGGAVQADGTLWTWGRYDLGDGQLSHPTSRPIKLGEGYRDVDRGVVSAAIKEDGSLWAWGRVDYGAMAGDVSQWDRSTGFTDHYQTTPRKIMDDVERIYTASSEESVAAIRTDGSLWTWGQDNQGLLGVLPLASGYPPMQAPQKIMDDVSAVYFGAGALVLQGDGSLWAWGRHSTFQTSYTSTAHLPGTFSDGPLGDGYLPVLLSRDTLFPTEIASDAPSDPEPMAVSSSGIAPQEAGVAQSVRQPLEIRDERVELAGYALSDGAGGSTTYVRLRDLAWLLNGTAAQFDVGYDGAITLASSAPYSSPNGTEGSAPFQGEQPYARWDGLTLVDGREVALRAFVLTDAKGGGHTYYKLRDLGQALGFNVGWSAGRGMYVEPGRPYSDAD